MATRSPSAQAYLKASNADVSGEFGHVVALSADGNTIAVGAHREGRLRPSDADGPGESSSSESGAAYVFAR